MRVGSLSFIVRFNDRRFGVRICWWVWQDFRIQVYFWKWTFHIVKSLQHSEHLRKLYFEIYDDYGLVGTLP